MPQHQEQEPQGPTAPTEHIGCHGGQGTSLCSRNERNSNKTVKPADETEAIADVIIREKEIAAGE